jgi:uncharacterized FlaG/YvyC family protein
MTKVETITIEGQDGKACIINKADFDVEKHKKFGKKPQKTEETKELGKFDREAAFEILTEAKVEFKKNASNDTLKELLLELEKAAKSDEDEKSFSVEAKDDKFVIVDKDGAQVGDLYDNEEAANTMLTVLEG